MTDIAGRAGSHTDDYTTWDAPYVLGSLSRNERREYEDHLATCPECQAAVAELAGLPGMLGLVDAETALTMIESPEPSHDVPPVPELLPRLAEAAERNRRRGRWAAVGGAVLAAAAAVAISVPIIGSVTTSPDRATTAEPVVFAQRAMDPLEPTPVSADVKIVTSEGRTRIVMNCSYAPGGMAYTWNYGLSVTSRDGRTFDLDQWPAGPDTVLTVDRTVDLAPDQIGSVQIKSANSGKVVLSTTL